MAEKSNIDELLAGMDRRTTRYKRTREYLEARARPGEVKIIQLKNPEPGLAESMTIAAGMCPCSICGHEFMWECEDADCQCCSSACT